MYSRLIPENQKFYNPFLYLHNDLAFLFRNLLVWFCPGHLDLAITTISKDLSFNNFIFLILFTNFTNNLVKFASRVMLNLFS